MSMEKNIINSKDNIEELKTNKEMDLFDMWESELIAVMANNMHIKDWVAKYTGKNENGDDYAAYPSPTTIIGCLGLQTDDSNNAWSDVPNVLKLSMAESYYAWMFHGFFIKTQLYMYELASKNNEIKRAMHVGADAHRTEAEVKLQIQRQREQLERLLWGLIQAEKNLQVLNERKKK